MAAHYTEQLNSVKAEMNKNRTHATHMIAKKSSALYAAIADGEKKQMGVNGELQEQTREATLNIADSLKDDFAQRLGALHKTVKSAEGRKQLSTMMEANKQELIMKGFVRDAIHKGETRMQDAEDKLVALNTKTKAALNMKITTEISTLAKCTNNQIEGLCLSSKEARDEMRKELLYAVRAMAKEAKGNLDGAVKVATAKFMAVNDAEAAAYKKNPGKRAEIAESITTAKADVKTEVNNAVATMAHSLTALKRETALKIKKTNTRIDAYAAQIAKESEDVQALMAEQMTDLTGSSSHCTIR